MTTHHIFKLSTGETLCVAEMPYMESVSVGVWAGVGGRHDPVELGGLAHFVEHMVFKGTHRRSARKLNADVESAGGNMDAYTSEDHTAFFIRGPAEKFPHFADVLLDIYRHSIFQSEDVQREREVIEEEIAMYKEQPQQQAEDLLWRTAWPGHPLGRPIAGTEESLRRIKTRALRSHASEWFGRKNTVISVAGRVNAVEVRAVLEKLLGGGLRPGRAPRTRRFPVSRLRRAPRLALEKREIDQVHIALAFHIPGRCSEHASAMRLLNVLLGENTSSRLWSALREDNGLCYDVGSDLTTLDEAGLLHIYAGVDPDKFPKALRIINRELSRFAEKGVSTRALKAACDYATAAHRLSLEVPSSVMTGMAECMLFFGRYIPTKDILDRLRTVTPAHILALAKQILHGANLTAAFVGPVPEQAAVEKMLVLPAA